MTRRPAIGIAVLAIAAALLGIAIALDGISRPSPTAPSPHAPRPAGAEERDTGPMAPIDDALQQRSAPGLRAPVEVRGVRALVGRVTDKDGAPLAAVLVATPAASSFEAHEEDWSDASATFARRAERRARRTRADTARDGTFRLPVPEGADVVTLRGLSRGHLPSERQVQLAPDRDTELGTLVFERGVIVAGRVLDRQGRPVAGATVTRAGENGLPDPDFLAAQHAALFAVEVATTDAEGRFVLPHEVSGRLELSARHPDHPPAVVTIGDAAAGQQIDALRIVLDDGAVIVGRVLDLPEHADGLRVHAQRLGTDGEPLGGGQPWMLGDPRRSPYAVGERMAAVAADGRFELRGLVANGRHLLWAARVHDGSWVPRRCSPLVEVPAGTASVELRYEPGCTLIARVVDARSQEPVEELQVQYWFKGGLLASMGASGVTVKPRRYPDGVLAIDELRPIGDAALSLTIDAAGYRPFERPRITLPRSGVLDLGIVRLEPKPAVRVRVLGADGEPVAAAIVHLRAPGDFDPGPLLTELLTFHSKVGRTDLSGSCAFDRPGGAEAVVHVLARAHAPYESEVLALPLAGDFEHEVRLRLGGRVAVTVLEKDGETAAAGAYVDLEFQDSITGRQTDASGRTVFEHLPEGRYRFRVGDGRSAADVDLLQQDGDGLGTWSALEVVDGATVQLELVAPEFATVAGLLREAGAALADATIVIAPRHPEDARWNSPGSVELRGHTARSDEDGRFAFEHLTGGEHVLWVRHASRAMGAQRMVRLRAGENIVELDLDRATLRGRVVTAEGAAIAGAKVRAVENDHDRGFGLPTLATDVNGAFALHGVVSDAPVHLFVDRPPFVPTWSQPIRLPASGVIGDVVVTLELGGTVRVRAPQDAMVQASPVGEPGYAKRTFGVPHPDGVFVLDRLRPGRWEIRVQPPGGEPVVVELAAGQTVELGG